jgi:hypothetical protein
LSMAVSTSFLLLFASWKNTRRRHLFTHFLMVPPSDLLFEPIACHKRDEAITPVYFFRSDQPNP